MSSGEGSCDCVERDRHNKLIDFREMIRIGIETSSEILMKIVYSLKRSMA